MKYGNDHPFVLWFTGLSGAGKSTTARAIQNTFTQQGLQSYLLDGDLLRNGLCRDLGFSAEDRSENIRRISEVAKLFVDAGLIVIVATISPLQKMRRDARAHFAENQFIEIFIDAPLSVCEKRDPKGLYQKVRAGKIAQFTGVDSLYETPEEPELHLRSDQQTVEDSVNEILTYLHQHGNLRAEKKRRSHAIT
ncbi:MAG TPA: adenylyl-sulfate kinase [Cellvibrio sp.]|nr:adenylyl-sulfate kinase [Cellvibrio sp.]